MNWTPSDGSRERHEADSPTNSWDPSSAPLAERENRRRQNGLQGINDLDFEALIEILGTNGQERANDLDVRSILLQVNEERSVEDEDSSAARGAAESELANTRKNLGQNNSAPRLPSLSAAADASAPILPLNLPSVQPASPRQPLPKISVNASPSRSKSDPLPKSAKGTEKKTEGGFTRLSNELGTAVEETKEGIAELRLRIQALKEEIRGFAPQLYHKAFNNHAEETKQPSTSKAPRAPRNNEKSAAQRISPAEAEENKNSSTAVQEEISRLTDGEVRNALTKLCLTTGLRPSNLITSSAQGAPPSNPPQDLADVTKALNFIADVDRVVWRRIGGATTDGEGKEVQDLYTEQNLAAMFDRIRLWERTARTRVTRQCSNL